MTKRGVEGGRGRTISVRVHVTKNFAQRGFVQHGSRLQLKYDDTR